MEIERNYKGLKKYEALLKIICRTEDYDESEEREWAKLFRVKYVSSGYKKNNYNELSDGEWEGCLGVACVISAIEGVTPNIFSISKHLDIPHYNIHLQRAFERLRVNGVLSKRFGAGNDPAFTGCAIDDHWQTGAEVEINAWCFIAGVAGGYVGMRESEKVENIENIEKVLKSESIDV